MELKYKPVVGVLILVLGLVNLVLSLLTGSVLEIITGLVFGLLGVLMSSVRNFLDAGS